MRSSEGRWKWNLQQFKGLTGNIDVISRTQIHLDGMTIIDYCERNWFVVETNSVEIDL